MQENLNAIPVRLAHLFDPIFTEYYNHHNVGRLATHQAPIDVVRGNPDRFLIPFPRDNGPDIHKMSVRMCLVDRGQIKIRVYEPDPVLLPHASMYAAYINYHGGGWTFGDLEMDEPFCRRITNEVNCVVFDVDYRKAPEHPFPIPVNDCYQAFEWIRNNLAQEYNIDPMRIAVGGVSAGAHLATVVSHLAAINGFHVAHQFLAVPLVDIGTALTHTGELSNKGREMYKSYQDYEETIALPLERMAYLQRQFLGCPRPAHLERNWMVSPMFADCSDQLAPATIVVAELDILKDEGKAYAEKLRNAGVSAEVVEYSGVPHSFMYYDKILDAAKQYNKLAVNVLTDALKEVNSES